MTDAFCPIYKEAADQKPWEKETVVNCGLLFDKFPSAWRKKETTYEFDKGIAGKKSEGGNWLHAMASRPAGDASLLEEACRRQRKLAENMGGETLHLKNSTRFITGMGREHPLENGITWLHTLGVPYLPGSGLKGMLRAWYRETHGEFKGKWHEDVHTETLFGSQTNGGGRFVLLDMLPTKPIKLVVDVMTPHYGDYYQHGDTPGDWQSPGPVHFLAVDAEQSWQLAILPAPTGCKPHNEDLKNIRQQLLEAFYWLGAGAKTAVGYGRFQRDRESENVFHQRREREREEQRQQEEAAAKEARFQKSIKNDSEPLQQLKKLQREHQWRREAADNQMIDDLTQFAESHAALPQDCLDWMRQWIESIPKYKGVWDRPQAKRGKAKNPKPKYSSAKIRKLVEQLNPHLR